MTTPDMLNLTGFIVGGLGSSLGMYGVFKQTNAYYPFKLSYFFEHLARVIRTYVTRGQAAANEQVHAAAKLGEARGEDRTQSLIGLYFVFVGFLFQLLGSLLLLMGTLLPSGAPG